MGRFFIHLVATAASIFVATQVGTGLHMDPSIPPGQRFVNLLLIAVIFGLVNAIIRPLVRASTCMINVLTLGLFTFVINAVMLYVTVLIGNHFQLGLQLNNFLSAIFASIVISVMSFVFGFLIPEPRRA